MTDWRRVGLVAGAVPVAALVTAVVVLVRAQGYEPLVQGSYSRSDAQVVRRADGREDLQLPWAPGATQVITVSVRNNGRHEVRLDGVDYARPSQSPVWITGARWEEGFGQTRQEPTAHAFPVDLPPEHEVSVQLSVQQRSCGWTARTGAGFDLLQVRTTRWGQTHSWTVKEVPAGLLVTAPATVLARYSVACPG